MWCSRPNDQDTIKCAIHKSYALEKENGFPCKQITNIARKCVCFVATVASENTMKSIAYVILNGRFVYIISK